MKKTPKRILGFAGLFLVAAMTVFAVFLPNPGAVATNSSVTDTIVVRVIATTPNVDITGPESGKTFVDSDQTITYNYENVETVIITLEYTDPDGNTITETLTSLTPGGQAGSGSLPLNLYEDYGYGDFVIKITGTSSDGVTDEDIIEFSFYPVTGTAEQEKDTDKVKVDLDYDDNSDIDYIEINVYDEDGNLVTPLSPVKVPRPSKTTELPFGNLPSGEYTIEITTVGTNGTRFKPSDTITINYKKPADEPDEPDEPVIPVPDTGGSGSPNTGGLFGNLDISASDYLISGLIVFFLVAICGIIVIGKHKEDKKRH